MSYVILLFLVFGVLSFFDFVGACIDRFRGVPPRPMDTTPGFQLTIGLPSKDKAFAGKPEDIDALMRDLSSRSASMRNGTTVS